MNLLLLLLFNLLPQKKDYYYVVDIKYPIKQQGSKHPIVVGDSVDINATYIFNSPRDKFIVYHPEKGIFHVVPKKMLPSSKINEILLILKDNLLPTTRQDILGIRSTIINSPQELDYYFRQYRKRLVIGTELIPLAPDGFPNREHRYFFLRYYYRGQEVNKPLAFVSPQNSFNSLYLQLDQQILRKNNIDISPEEAKNMQLFYYDSKQEKSVPMAKVQLVVVPQQQVLSLIKVVKRLSAQTHAGKTDIDNLVFEDVYSALANCYGDPDPQKLRLLYNQIL